MLGTNHKDGQEPEGRVSVRRWILITIGGVVAALALGFLISYVYTSTKYGGNQKDDVLSGRKQSPSAGKAAYDRKTHLFLGIIKSEGYSPRRGTQVYYVQRAGGDLIEVPKDLIDVGQPK